jgi:hypothetical protein
VFQNQLPLKVTSLDVAAGSIYNTSSLLANTISLYGYNVSQHGKLDTTSEGRDSLILRAENSLDIRGRTVSPGGTVLQAPSIAMTHAKFHSEGPLQVKGGPHKGFNTLTIASTTLQAMGIVC